MKAYFIALVASFASVTNLTCATSSTSTSSIIFTGDILLDRGVRKIIEHHGIHSLFDKRIDSLFSKADVVVGNLECPATSIKAPMQKRFIFRGEPIWLSALKKHGFTHLNLANNHSIDQGRNGLIDTERNILKNEIKPVGIGKNMNEAAKPILLMSYPRKVWLIASLRMALENFAYLPDCPCINQESTEAIIKRIHSIKQKDPQAVVIISLHWGEEHTLQPVPSQRLEAHRLMKAGADALICHHPHTFQTIEHYKGHDIYYSIGNFIFDQQDPINTKACMVKVEVSKDQIKTVPLPIEIIKCKPHLCE